MRMGTKATRIPEAVKRAVFERDKGRCVICQRSGNPWCHVVPRSQGGLGIEENIVTLCNDCHRRLDQSADRKRMRDYIEHYLMNRYPEWDRDKLVYRKGNEHA